MMFKTKHLTQDEAMTAARAAAVVARHGQVVVQAQNGRFKWGRASFWTERLLTMLALRVWYVSPNGETIQVK